MFQLRITAALTAAVASCLAPLASAESTLTGTITGYGSASNDPTGSNAVCCGLSGGEHSATYNDPGTCASDNSKYPVNTKIYIPGLQKYFIVQDSCADCVNQAVHFDLWMGPDSYTNYNNLLKCAESGGASDGTIILDPAPGYPVDSTPLLDASGNCDGNVNYARTSPGSGGGSTGGGSGSVSSSAPVPVSTSPALSTTMAKAGKVKSSAPSTPTGGSGSSSSGGSTGSCDWAGHCKGAACQTYNDCGDPFSCVNGKCA